MLDTTKVLLASVLFGLFSVSSSAIIDLSRDKQLDLLTAARARCILKMETTPYPKTGLYCNRTWDTIACWSDVPAGTIAIQSCPDYFNLFDTDAYATRKCNEDGTWYLGHTNKPWTNYTACLTNGTANSDKYKIIAEHMPRIRVMLSIGYSVSLVSLTVSVIVMLYLKKLHCPRNCVHINLFISFIFRACTSLVREHLIVGGMGFRNDVYQEEDGSWALIPDRSNWECKLFFTIFHYSLGANYMWIFIEGLYLHMLIFVSVFSESSSVVKYIIAGWLTPFVWVIPWAIVRALLLNVYCWNTLQNKHYNWIMRAPITLTILINFFIFVNTLCVLFTKLKSQNTPEARKFRKLAKSTLVLIPLFGVHYIVFLGFPDNPDNVDNVDAELVRMYFEMFFNSFQGFMVAMMFCFLNGEVQAEITKKWNRYKLRRFGGRGSQRTATSMSTYLSKARNSLHSIQSLMNDRKDSVYKNGESPPTKNKKRSSSSSLCRQPNGHCSSGINDHVPSDGDDSPKLANGNGSLIFYAIAEEDSGNHVTAQTTSAQIEQVDDKRDSCANDDDLTQETNEVTAMLHSEPADRGSKSDDSISENNDARFNEIMKEIRTENFMLDDTDDSAKRLLTDEEILQEDLV